MSKHQPAETVLDLIDPRWIPRSFRGSNKALNKSVDSYESRIIDNADIIESYYLKYAEKAKLAPEQCKEYLAQELGLKLIELMEREL